MAGEEDRDFENFLKSHDPWLLKYKHQFGKYDVQCLNTLKYVRPQEVDAIELQ